MEKNYHGWFAVLTFLLLVIAGLLAEGMYSRMAEEERRRKIADEAHEISSELSTAQQKVLDDYTKALDSYETKSVYHQIYHANNTQVMMMVLMIQEQRLLATLLAGTE
ncbi:MAG: hypothetical protein RBU25_20180 [Lentisphaeria bacterium]|jgi:hypothetical protein|nr:hypothetical protein [Lentisphaeria bacterium]